MSDRYYNPFAGIDVFVPVEFHEDVSRYSQPNGKPDQAPFPRMVDLWFLAMCLAAKDGLVPVDASKQQMKKIIEGSILSTDPWRVHTIMLIAIAQSGNLEITTEPRKMMAIANGLAIAGIPKVLELLKDGGGDPIWNISEGIEGLVRKKAA